MADPPPEEDRDTAGNLCAPNTASPGGGGGPALAANQDPPCLPPAPPRPAHFRPFLRARQPSLLRAAEVPEAGVKILAWRSWDRLIVRRDMEGDVCPWIHCPRTAPPAAS